jgi:histidine triad (HIT) family protein
MLQAVVAHAEELLLVPPNATTLSSKDGASVFNFQAGFRVSRLDRALSACNRGLIQEDKMPAYDPNNIFAKILRGEIPCHKIYEDEKALAFLDIMPRAPGHTLVIPKAHARNILDVAPDDLAHVMKIAQRVAKVSVNIFGADGVTLQQFSESAGGQVVFHLHVHVIPRQEGIALKPPASVKESPDVLKDQAAKLAAALAAP